MFRAASSLSSSRRLAAGSRCLLKVKKVSISSATTRRHCAFSSVTKQDSLDESWTTATLSPQYHYHDHDAILSHQHRHHDFNQPMPALALAYDYVDDDDDDEEEQEKEDFMFRDDRNDLKNRQQEPFSQQQQQQKQQPLGEMTITAKTAASGGLRHPASTNTSSPPLTSTSHGAYPSPSSTSTTTTTTTLHQQQQQRKNGGGGGSGGGGRHKCPKCGTFVTFGHSDFDDNTYYCASCSGWFVMSPNTTITSTSTGAALNSSPSTTHSNDQLPNNNNNNIKYEEMMAEKQQQQQQQINKQQQQHANTSHSRFDDPPVLMQHIPDSNHNNHKENSSSSSSRQQQHRSSSQGPPPPPPPPLGGGGGRGGRGNGGGSDYDSSAPHVVFGGGGGGGAETTRTTAAQAAASIGAANNHSQQQQQQQHVVVRRMPTPREIMRGLNEYVIGQKNVKVALSVGVYNHYKRIFVAESSTSSSSSSHHHQPPNPYHQHHGPGGAGASLDNQNDNFNPSIGTTSQSFIPVRDGPSIAELNLGQFGSTTTTTTTTNENNSNKAPYCEAPDISSITDTEFSRDVEDVEIDKSNILLLGPTGSGKTLLVKTLARLIDVPLVIADATCLTQAGYVGEDVESILFKLYLESGQDIERCQKGIIYIDEADKIRKSGGNISISRDVSGEGVQHALLKIVEGNVINVPKEPGRKNPRGDFLQIDTTNILFICGGAYSGLERIINKRMDAASIGFGAQMKKAIDDPKVQGRYFDNAIPKDLVEYGMIPEFVGRFPVIVSTKGLDIDNLVDILTVPKNSIMKQYRRLFAMDDVNFHVTKDGLNAIAEMAFARGSGARGLRSITDSVLMETQYIVPSMPDVHTVYLDEAAVRRDRKPILLKDASMTVAKFEALMQGQREKNDNGDGTETLVDGAVVVNIDEDMEEEAA